LFTPYICNCKESKESLPNESLVSGFYRESDSYEVDSDHCLSGMS